MKAGDPHFNTDEIEAMEKRTETTIKVLNIVFYTLVIACCTLGEYFWLNYPEASYALNDAWYFFDVILKLVSGSLMILSLLKFKVLVKSMLQSNANHFTSERLMTLHLGIFLMFIVANIGFNTNYAIALAKTEDWNEKANENHDVSSWCRYKITSHFF